jgi:hypothetical protein
MAEDQLSATGLRAGAAQVDITPQAGVHLAGDVGSYRPAKLVGEPIFAKALVLESGGRKLCLVTLDVTIVTAPYTAMIRQGAADRFGLEPDAVMVHATQTHSAPSLGHFMVDEEFPAFPPEFEWVRGGSDEYSAWAAERAVQALGQALGALEPVQIGAASGIEGRFAHNRRAVGRDGRVGMPGPKWQEPLGPTWIRYIEGPIDPEVGVVCLRGESLRVPALLAHYTCHPVHVFPKPIVSPDWPGALSDELRATHGEGCVPLILNGACGNINPWPPFDPEYVEDHRRMGRALAETVEKVLQTLTFTDEAAVDWRVRHLKIPLRDVPPAELEWARKVLDESPLPAWTDDTRTRVSHDWMAAASIWSVELMRRRDASLDYEVQVLRIGDVAIVGLPGEPFVEGQLQIKLASPTVPTYIAHCTSHYVGYVPTREALPRGGHEASTRFWAKLVPEALDMIVEAATQELTELFRA